MTSYPTLIAPNAVLDGRYVVESVLGQGGMAVVYRARHLQLGTPCAVKVLTVQGRGIRERLLQEGRVQATLRHPNIVAVTDVVDVDGAPGLVMELIDGPSLESLLAQHRLSEEQVDEIAQGIFAGLLNAHRRGLIHRDLKPGNILLARVAGRLVPKIADFGLAKVLTEDGGVTRTRSGMMMGTPAYMAPEQMRNAKAVDQRADIFALGAILYEMLSGERAFEGDDLVEVLSAVRNGRVVALRARVPNLPDRFERAVHAALATSVDDRPRDVSALMELWNGTSATKPGLWAQIIPVSTPETPAPPSVATQSAMTWTDESEPVPARAVQRQRR